MKEKITKSILFIFLIFFLFFISANPLIYGMYPKNQHISTEIPTIKGNIMLTGFWNPTGKMIKQFSTSHYLNPDGWKGENWNNLGYDIYSYFPKPGLYNGTFEVDYQNTWNDFWNITSEINPIAIISFGAGNGPWEIEYNARNLDSWIDDNNAPYQPTPCPPDDTVEVDYVRHSTLPVEEIKNGVNEGTNIEAWIDWDGDPGKYLCEYIAYLGMWYQDLHNSADDEYQCKAAGFIHVKSNVPKNEAIEATNITIKKTIEFLDSLNESPYSPSINGPSSGKIGNEYNYIIMTTDPNNDEVSYYIDWGDGNIDNWTRMLPSGEEYNVSHIWEERGTYVIKVKAKDVYGDESSWSDPLTITMPRVKIYNQIPKIIIWLLDKFPILRLVL